MGQTQTEESQGRLDPEAALALLQEGNARFVSDRALRRDYARQIRSTASDQYPFAVVLGCIDSRVPVETVLDQGIGDIFAVRVAGNVVNDDVLGSMEFACSVAGSMIVLVLGHTSCGAVQGSIDGVRVGNLSGLLARIEPAIESVPGERDPSNLNYVDQVAEANVLLVIDQIRDRSPVLAELEAAGSIALAGAMYDVSTGVVRFL